METVKFILIFISMSFSFNLNYSYTVFMSNVDRHLKTRNNSFNDSQNSNKILERCQLCTTELVKKNGWIKKGLVEKSSSCYPEGDFHDFYHNSWVISIIPPDGLLDECYIDLLAPKENVFSNEKIELIDRIIISRNCSERCRSTNSHFKHIYPQTWNRNSYVLKLANKSGNNESN